MTFDEGEVANERFVGKESRRCSCMDFKKDRMIVTFDFASTQLSRRSCFIPYKDIDITAISHYLSNCQGT